MPSGDARIASLDVLRGVAILGTFASNAWVFAQPGGPAAWLSDPGAPGLVETGLLLLSNGKFLALLTLLFGVGLALQHRSAVRRGLPWPGRYPVRALVLFAEGLLHYLLIFEFDVLMGYAITALLVARLIASSERVQHRWTVAVGSVYAAVLLAITALLVAVPVGPQDPAPVPASTGSWTAQVAQRVEQFPVFRLELVFVVPSATVLFLVGARLLRAGAFEDTAAGARIRRRLAWLGLGVAFPLNAMTAFAGEAWVLVDRYLLPPVVALGLLGLGTTLVLRVRRGPVQRGLAAVGRMALTCYVLQNLVAGALCYDWGLGLATRFADARPGWVVGLWAGVSLLLVAASTLWLRHADRGPLELMADRLHGARRQPGPTSATR
ncbi:MAG TPA: DUF418 domain-containing protein [Pseudonocardia sp.]|nr:DUF418 domain-containing protein [Pseudonocardia sp.]